MAVDQQGLFLTRGLNLGEKGLRLLQQDQAGRRFVSKNLRGAGIHTESAGRTTTTYGRPRVEGDGIVRADLLTRSAITLPEPDPLAKIGESRDTRGLFNSSVPEQTCLS